MAYRTTLGSVLSQHRSAAEQRQGIPGICHGLEYQCVRSADSRTAVPAAIGADSARNPQRASGRDCQAAKSIPHPASARCACYSRGRLSPGRSEVLPPIAGRDPPLRFGSTESHFCGCEKVFPLSVARASLSRASRKPFLRCRLSLVCIWKD